MDAILEKYDVLVCSAARRLTGAEHRSFIAEPTLTLCDGNVRRAERQFGWGRQTVQKGLHERHSGLCCVESFAARGRPRWEADNPQRAADIRDIVEPRTQADPELKSARRYTNLSAAEVLAALREQKHYSAADLPSERSMRDILNRMNYRLKRIQKGQPLKKTKDTDAIFANVRAVQEQARLDPATLEISVDTKAKVSLGEYSRGRGGKAGLIRKARRRRRGTTTRRAQRNWCRSAS